MNQLATMVKSWPAWVKIALAVGILLFLIRAWPKVGWWIAGLVVLLWVLKMTKVIGR